MKLYNKETFKESEGITKFNSAHFYVFYPVKKQLVITMGENKRNRCGPGTAQDIPTAVKSTLNLNAVKISSSRNSTMILTSENTIYYTGQKCGASVDDFTLMKMPKKEVPDKIFCGRTSKFVIDKEGKTFYCGQSFDFELPNNIQTDQLKEFKLTSDEANTEKIIEISNGYWYNLFVTDAGKLWASGRKFLKRFGIDSEVPAPINLSATPEGALIVVKAWASQVKDT